MIRFALDAIPNPSPDESSPPKISDAKQTIVATSDYPPTSGLVDDSYAADLELPKGKSSFTNKEMENVGKPAAPPAGETPKKKPPSPDTRPVTNLKDSGGGKVTLDIGKSFAHDAGESSSEIDHTAPPATSPPTIFTGSPKTLERPLILYAYSETPSAHINIQFFIKHGLHDSADFIFILNGDTDIMDIIPNATNIRYVRRPNDCYDLGAYAEVLTKNDLYKKYEKFIMLNASIRGPFLPVWAKNCWSEMYLARITKEVKLVGMTANCWPAFHVQSMIWATDSIGLTALLTSPTGINDCFHTWDSAVKAEVGASAVIKEAGYKIDVMMSAFHGDELYEEHCDGSENGDVLWDHKYYGTNVHPYETIFMKSNRDIDPVLMEKLTGWHEGANYSSYDVC